MYVKVTGGLATYYSVEALYRDNPDTSFPRTPTGALLAEWNVYSCQLAPRPQSPGKTAQRIAPELVDGVWSERWALADITADETAAQWSTVRAERNGKLAACDWTQLADAPVDDLQWAVYRQALRDVPTSQSDPFNINWPIEPE